MQRKQAARLLVTGLIALAVGCGGCRGVGGSGPLAPDACAV